MGLFSKLNLSLELQSKKSNPRRGEYNVYSTFQSHEPEFDYLKSLEIEEKINKIRWLKRKNPAHFLLSTNGERSEFLGLVVALASFEVHRSVDLALLTYCWFFVSSFHLADKTIKLWKVSERDKKAEGYNLKEDSGLLRDPSTINTLRVSPCIREQKWESNL